VDFCFSSNATVPTLRERLLRLPQSNSGTSDAELEHNAGTGLVVAWQAVT
jgi:hypothetical protein